jgi:hypothetical protein
MTVQTHRVLIAAAAKSEGEGLIWLGRLCRIAGSDLEFRGRNAQSARVLSASRFAAQAGVARASICSASTKPEEARKLRRFIRNPA